MFGDIVTYLENDYLITHRIIDKKDNVFTTKGDSNNENDMQIVNTDILGKVVFCSAFLGKFISCYMKKIFIFATGFIIFLNIYCNFKEKKSEKTKKIE